MSSECQRIHILCRCGKRQAVLHNGCALGLSLTRRLDDRAAHQLYKFFGVGSHFGGHFDAAASHRFRLLPVASFDSRVFLFLSLLFELLSLLELASFELWGFAVEHPNRLDALLHELNSAVVETDYVPGQIAISVLEFHESGIAHFRVALRCDQELVDGHGSITRDDLSSQHVHLHLLDSFGSFLLNKGHKLLDAHCAHFSE